MPHLAVVMWRRSCSPSEGRTRGGPGSGETLNASPVASLLLRADFDHPPPTAPPPPVVVSPYNGHSLRRGRLRRPVLRLDRAGFRCHAARAHYVRSNIPFVVPNTAFWLTESAVWSVKDSRPIRKGWPGPVRAPGL